MGEGERQQVDPDLRRPLAPHLRDYFEMVNAGFGDRPDTDDAHRSAEAAVFEPERTLAAYDGDKIVGGASAYTFELTVPGRRTVTAAGVSGVAVLPTHTRRGILTALMTAQLDQAAERAEPVAVLNASDSQIYSRYGFGSADRATRIEIDTRHAGFEWPPDPGGALDLVDRTEALPLVADVYDHIRLRRPGTIARSEAWWALVLHHTASWKGGGDPFVVIHRNGDGEPDGYAVYHVNTGWEDGNPTGTVDCRELEGVDWKVEATLWRYLCGIDLVDKVRAYPRPLDDPVQWRLQEPRRLLVKAVVDMLWVRIVDVAAALSGRGYGTEGEVTLDIRDPFRPKTAGVFHLTGGPDGATCERVDGDGLADLIMNVNELGSVFLGGIDVSTLAAAGRVEEKTADALFTADAMFASRPAPYCATTF
jgi:predicted acetyltransferase